MANVFEDLGRTGTLRAVTNDISNLALNLRQGERQNRALGIQEKQSDLNMAIQSEQLAAIKQKRELDNKVYPIDMALGVFDDPATKKLALTKAEAMGFIEDVGGQKVIRRGDGERFLNVIMDPKGPYAEEFAQTRLNSITQQYEQATAELANLQQTKPNDKNIPVLQQQIKALANKRIGAIQSADLLKKTKPLYDKYTPESIAEYLKNGATDESVLVSLSLEQERMTPSNLKEWEYYKALSPGDKEKYLTMKRAEKTINLGDRVIQTTPGRPGVPAATYKMGLPPEQEPEIKGKQQKEKNLADLEVYKKKLYPKVRETLNGLNRQWDSVDTSIDDAINLVSPYTAGLGAWGKSIPATPQKRLSETLKTIQANIGFDKLQDMRANSPTGGALGQVSDFENRLLQAVQGSLDQSQDAATLKRNLTRIKENLKSLREQKKKAFSTDFKDFLPKAQAPQAAIDHLMANPDLAEEFKKKYGYLPEGF